jgi:ferric-dicitrate binding protein FerR (iron transport regulator)
LVQALEAEQRAALSELLDRHRQDDTAFAELRGLWEQTLAGEAEEALDTRTFAQRSALRDQIRAITTHMAQVNLS